MLKMLDAEFALVLFDGETGEIMAGRDPIGIRPDVFMDMIKKQVESHFHQKLKA